MRSSQYQSGQTCDSAALPIASAINRDCLTVNHESVRNQTLVGVELVGMLQMPSQGSVLTPDSSLLKLNSHTFQNAVDKNSWQLAAFSSDVEHVSAASALKASHHIYIWNRLGILERILEGQ